MAIEVKNASNFSVDVKPKVVIYGPSGAGKTSLAKTLKKVLIISAEKGLLSISGSNIDYVEVTDFSQIGELYKWLTEDEEARAKYDYIMFDSVTDIAETVLSHEKKKVSDKRQAYGELADKMMYILKSFRDISYYGCIFIAKLDKVKDEISGAMLYAPMMPGQVLSKQLPYLVDEVFALDVSPEDEKGNKFRFLRTGKNYQWDAKDRSGKLSEIERPDLQWVFDKMAGYDPTPRWYWYSDNEEYVRLNERQYINGVEGGIDLFLIGKHGTDEEKAEDEKTRSSPNS